MELVFLNVSSASFEVWQKPQNACISKTHLFPSILKIQIISNSLLQLAALLTSALSGNHQQIKTPISSYHGPSPEKLFRAIANNSAIFLCLKQLI
jgi:hypothetical protein